MFSFNTIMFYQVSRFHLSLITHDDLVIISNLWQHDSLISFQFAVYIAINYYNDSSSLIYSKYEIKMF